MASFSQVKSTPNPTNHFQNFKKKFQHWLDDSKMDCSLLNSNDQLRHSPKGGMKEQYFK